MIREKEPAIALTEHILICDSEEEARRLAAELKPYEDQLHKTEAFGHNVVFVTADYAPQRTELLRETIERLNKHNDEEN